ncbi:MAG: phospholipase D-like domain-containing protein [Candidatus Brocadia sp.]|nr:phospholipase D-like domain-containing protein [Candidatus Brocadia sp.]
MKRIFILVILGWVSGALYAENTAYYTPDGTIEERVREGIENTQRCINICIHNFAALNIEHELEIARDRGIRIRVVILEQDDSEESGPLAEALIHKGFDVRILKTHIGNAQVQDFILFDDRVLVTGVYNWLAYRNRNNCNDVLFHCDQDRIRTYKNIFSTLFTDGEAIFLLYNSKELAKINMPALASASNALDTRQIIQEDRKTAIIKENSRPGHEAISKDYLDISFEELDKQIGRESTLSRSERNKFWKKYKGKYVRWSGIVSYKGMGRVDWNRVGVSRQNSQNAEVEILFDWRMFEKVMSVQIGSMISYSGKLVSRPGINAPYRLDDGNIE